MKTYKRKNKLWIKYYVVNDYFILSEIKDSLIGIQIRYANI